MTKEMILRRYGAGINAGIAETMENKPAMALDYLQSIYRDPLQPASVRMRAASICLPFESPKLAVTAMIRDEASFAAALDRAIARSGKSEEMKVIDHVPEGTK